uniref:Uncharacterized protein n=1 Tax=Ditylenchus dipsaci TaxID=166011 RepID=A0A915CYE3_9BILA
MCPIFFYRCRLQIIALTPEMFRDILDKVYSKLQQLEDSGASWQFIESIKETFKKRILEVFDNEFKKTVKDCLLSSLSPLVSLVDIPSAFTSLEQIHQELRDYKLHGDAKHAGAGVKTAIDFEIVLLDAEITRIKIDFQKKTQEECRVKVLEIEQKYGVTIGYKNPVAEERVEIAIRGSNESDVNSAVSRLDDFVKSGASAKNPFLIKSILSSTDFGETPALLPYVSIPSPNQKSNPLVQSAEGSGQSMHAAASVPESSSTAQQSLLPGTVSS